MEIEERLKELERRVENYALLYSSLLDALKLNQSVQKFIEERIDILIKREKEMLKEYGEKIKVLEEFHKAVIENQGHYVDLKLLSEILPKKDKLR